MSGFGTVTQKSDIAVGGTLQQNVTMRAAGVTATVEVVAETPAPIATGTVGLNVRKEEIDTLATPRTLQGIATLAPSLTERSPNTNQVSINGAFAYDNVFMINGVDVNDNLFASPQNLVIEDAIEETQVITSGISAEYGRFSGGVINAITRSGGNTFSGSYRMNLSNPSWTDETPFQKTRTPPQENLDRLQNTQEATFGGPIVRDRLWFFTAGRYGVVDTQQNNQHGLTFVRNDTTKRGEIKLTGTVAANHTIQGGYLNNPRTVTNDSGILNFAIDVNSLQTRNFPNHYYYTNYRGVFNTILLEGQYSQRKFRFDNSGGTSEVITDSPFISATQCACLYNAPYFDATDPTGRNNQQFTTNATFFWTRGGRHDTKAGYEWFQSQLVGGNSQSSTDYVFNVDFASDAAGAPLKDAQGRIVPHFVPGESYLEYFPAVRGATMNVNTNSFFVQDKWLINEKLTADLGVRFEAVDVVSTGDITSVNTSPRFVPRLGLSYDVKGTGSHVVHVTYGQYSGRYNEAQVGGNSPVGNPNYLPTFYQGPEGNGLGFGPGFDVANYPVSSDNLASTPAVPLANIFVDENLKTPLVHEFTTSYGVGFGGGRGFAEGSYIFRRTVNMIEDFITREGGTTDVTLEGLDLGEVSNIVYQNSDIGKREYQALVFQGRYRTPWKVTANGHYTLQLKNHGNFEGEGTNLPGDTSPMHDYPEAIPADRYFPYGRLQNYQQHRIRMWAIYDLDLGRWGRAATSGLWRYDSGSAYSNIALNVAPTSIQRDLAAAAGYPEAPPTAHVYFGERGSETFDGSGIVDWSTTYDIPVFKDLRPWLKFDIYNIFNNDKLIAWSTTIRPDPNSPRDAFGIPTGFIPSNAATYGTATGATVSNGDIAGIPAYPQWVGASNGGRTYRFAFGVRF